MNMLRVQPASRKTLFKSDQYHCKILFKSSSFSYISMVFRGTGLVHCASIVKGHVETLPLVRSTDPEMLKMFMFLTKSVGLRDPVALVMTRRFKSVNFDIDNFEQENAISLI